MTRLFQTLNHTPSWVFVLFFALLMLGMRQMRERQARPIRLAVVPIATSLFSIYGVISTFGLRLGPSCAWLIGAALGACVVFVRRPRSARYDASARIVHIPGSVVPLVAMMGIFFTKYALTVALMADPSLRERAPLVLAASAFLGCISGVLAGRAIFTARDCFRAPFLSSGSPA